MHEGMHRMKSVTSLTGTVWGAAALALGLAATPVANPAAAFEIPEAGLTVGVTPTISSDYLFRGISQTRNRPAVQGTIDIQHTSGFYVGAFVSNVTFLGTNARQEVDVLGGYRFELAGVKLDVGGIGYIYPGYEERPGQFDLNYAEAAVRASYELDPVKFLLSGFYSPNFQAESRNSLYVEGGVEVKVPIAGLDLTLAGRVGHQWIDRNERFGTPNYLNWNATVSVNLYDFILTVGYYDTDIRRSECGGGQRICSARAMVTLSRTF